MIDKEVDNITFVEYVNLQNKADYNYILTYSNLLKKPLDLFGIGLFQDNTFGFVKDVQEVLNYEGLTFDRLINIISEYKGIGIKEIALHKLFDLQRCRVFFKEQIDFINNLESTGLGHASSIDEQAAGIDRFAIYRSFPQLDKLAGGDTTKFDAVKKIPYIVQFTKLKYEADKDAYSSDYNNIINSKR